MGSPAMDSVLALADDVRQLRADLADIRTDVDVVTFADEKLKDLVEDFRRDYNSHCLDTHGGAFVHKRVRL